MKENNGQLSMQLQMWNQTWIRLVAMITDVVPFPSLFPQSSDHQRMLLEELCAKMCQKAIDPTDSDEYHEIKDKLERCRAKLADEREQNTKLNAMPKRRSRLETPRSGACPTSVTATVCRSDTKSPSRKISYSVEVKRTPSASRPETRPLSYKRRGVSPITRNGMECDSDSETADLNLVADAITQAFAERGRARSGRRYGRRSPR
jgi:hypothetical protein